MTKNRQSSDGRTQEPGQNQEPQSRTAMQSQNQTPSARQGDDNNRLTADKLATGLGWFSLGLGLTELLMPRTVARITGVDPDNNENLIRAYGVREIASGLAIFAQGDRPAEAVWSRVAGDALDLASIGVAFSSPDSNKVNLTFATMELLAVTALDVICAQQLTRKDNGVPTSQTRKSLIINRSPEELYQAWRKFEQLPQFMKYLQSVSETGQGRSHWVARGPAGTSVEWDAEIIEDRPNQFIAWQSLENSDVQNSGSVEFRPAPGNRGTIVTVEINYSLPGGVIGDAVAKLLREDPGALGQETLRGFKQFMEIGEVIISDGAIWDNGFLTQRAAQPADRAQLAAAASTTNPVLKSRAASAGRAAEGN
jgi:uncharacterized membrane protein